MYVQTEFEARRRVNVKKSLEGVEKENSCWYTWWGLTHSCVGSFCSCHSHRIARVPYYQKR